MVGKCSVVVLLAAVLLIGLSNSITVDSPWEKLQQSGFGGNIDGLQDVVNNVLSQSQVDKLKAQISGLLSKLEFLQPNIKNQAWLTEALKKLLQDSEINIQDVHQNVKEVQGDALKLVELINSVLRQPLLKVEGGSVKVDFEVLYTLIQNNISKVLDILLEGREFVKFIVHNSLTNQLNAHYGQLRAEIEKHSIPLDALNAYLSSIHKRVARSVDGDGSATPDTLASALADILKEEAGTLLLPLQPTINEVLTNVSVTVAHLYTATIPTGLVESSVVQALNVVVQRVLEVLKFTQEQVNACIANITGIPLRAKRSVEDSADVALTPATGSSSITLISIVLFPIRIVLSIVVVIIRQVTVIIRQPIAIITNIIKLVIPNIINVVVRIIGQPLIIITNIIKVVIPNIINVVITIIRQPIVIITNIIRVVIPNIINVVINVLITVIRQPITVIIKIIELIIPSINKIIVYVIAQFRTLISIIIVNIINVIKTAIATIPSTLNCSLKKVVASLCVRIPAAVNVYVIEPMKVQIFAWVDRVLPCNVTCVLTSASNALLNK